MREKNVDDETVTIVIYIIYLDKILHPLFGMYVYIYIYIYIYIGPGGNVNHSLPIVSLAASSGRILGYACCGVWTEHVFFDY